MRRFVISLTGGGGACRTAPAASRHDGCIVAARGFIANAAELRSDARRRGRELADGDAALFANAYRRWGVQLQRHVLGEYAVAVFDEAPRKLVFTHDGLGLVPGFYAHTQDGIVAGSHLDEVVALVGDRALDDEYVADYFALGVPSGDRTPYRAVRRLPPGCTVVWDGGRLRSERTWDLARVAPLRLRDDAEYEERFRTLIAQGVRSALEPGVSTWCELSGGLDSSSVISVAAASCGRVLPAFSMVYGKSMQGDELPWMRAVVQRYGLPWHSIDVDAYAPFAELPDVAFAEPNIAMPVWPLYREYARRLERNGVEVMLTGIGGDHIFAGDMPEPNHLGDPLLRLDVAGCVRGLLDWQRRSPLKRSLLHWAAGNAVRPLVRHALGLHGMDDRSATFELPPWIDRRFARAASLERRVRTRYATRCRTPGDQQFWDSVYKLGSSAGTMRDAVAETFAFRNPLLYRPLVEFMFAIPWAQRVRPDQDRALQRRAMTGILPEQVRTRKGKRGAEQAYFEGLRTGSAWLEILRDNPRIVERGYVDARGWREAVDRARYGRMHTMRHIIGAASLECWLRQADRHLTKPSVITPQGEINDRQDAVYHS